MCNVYAWMVFAERWSGEAASLDISCGRSRAGGAHSGVRQSLWKWFVLQLCLKAECSGIQHCRLLCGNWNATCILGVTRHEAQQWCLAHAFELVELNPQELPDEDGEFYRHKLQWHHVYFNCSCFFCEFRCHCVLPYRWLSRIHRSKENCPGSQCQRMVQCGDERW